MQRNTFSAIPANLDEKIHADNVRLGLQLLKGMPTVSEISAQLKIDIPALNANKLQIISGLLGKGGFGSVYLGQYVDNKKIDKLACKKILIPGTSDSKNAEYLLNEIYFMALFTQEQAPNIVKFAGLIIEKPFYVLCMEYVSMGSLDELIDKNCQAVYQHGIRFQFIDDITQGIKWMHDRNILHNDLKSPNILIERKANHYYQYAWHAKLADFGFTNFAGTFKGRGTPLWQATELLKQDINSKQSDIFSLGVVIWEIITISLIEKFYKQENITSIQGLFDFLVTHRAYISPHVCSLKWELIINLCWQNTAENRLSVDELLECYFLNATEILENYHARIPCLLSLVCKHGSLSWVKRMLANNADLNEKSMEGFTPFYYACTQGHVEVAENLMQHGADTQIKSPQGLSPFMVACKNGHHGIIYLLQGDVDINETNDYGLSPFFMACQHGQNMVVEILLSLGADYRKASHNGMTPFQVAIQKGHHAIVKRLLALDRAFLRDINPTPLDLVFKYQHNEIIFTLMSLSSGLDLLAQPIMSLATLESAKRWSWQFGSKFDAMFDDIKAAHCLVNAQALLAEKKTSSKLVFFKNSNKKDSHQTVLFRKAVSAANSPLEKLIVIYKLLDETSNHKLSIRMAAVMNFDNPLLSNQAVVKAVRIFLFRCISRHLQNNNPALDTNEKIQDELNKINNVYAMFSKK